jgi:uncharacterized membrane protein
VVLWPGDAATGIPAPSGAGAQRAEVEQVARFPCPQSRRSPCQGLRFRLLDGPGAGGRSELTLPGTDVSPAVDRGDTIRVLRNDVLSGTPGAGAAPPPAGAVDAFVFIDFERRSPLYLLAVVFAVLVVLLGRAQGVRSLVGLGLSLVVVTQFVVPAILAGEPPLPVALVGALAVMFLTLALAHGVGVKSMAAALGASGTLVVTALLALLFVELASITGFASEEATLLQGGASAEGRSLSLEGLVLAGMVVGALGVLDDVTVSQASVVLALRRADPRQPLRRLFGEALTVGRDHLSATVNTLVFAYVGAALPVLLIFESQATSFGEALNREIVATEVVAMLVGSIGLILAVPLTTALAAWLAGLVPEGALPADEHGHHH